MPNKIVYLLGSGSTHAVLKDYDIMQSLLTHDIQDYIGKKFTSRGVEPVVWNELLTTKDVEHLISVLDFQHKRSASEKLRSYYRDAIVSLSADISASLPVNLYTVLCDLHLNLSSDFLDEELLCFLTLNYEDILERTIKKHLRQHVNYGIESQPNHGADGVKVFKLHGSFNWKNTCPIEIRRMKSVTESRALWIPPGVDKRKENYPFNLLWGKATESLMNCDVLRIIGCSLSRNDWGLIPIIYTVQKFHNVGKMKIEVIDFPNIGDSIKNNYGFHVKKFSELEEVLEQYRGLLGGTDEEIQREIETVFDDKDKSNPFKAWLEAKIEHIIKSNGNKSQVLQATKFANDFYNKLS